MAEDPRRSAEIRRMASQKVAAELIKASTYAAPSALAGEHAEEEDRKHFISLVDWIDADVVAAGDRAESAAKPPNRDAPPPTPQNGSEAGSEPATALSGDQSERMTKLLGKIDPELLKLKFYEQELPSTTIPEAVAAMTKVQAKNMMPWIKENINE